MTSDRPYARVYLDIPDDERFSKVYPDKEAFGWWTTLLMIAEACFPEPAALPRGITDRVLDLLVESGTVELRPGDRYVFHGLATERERRAEARSRAASVAGAASAAGATRDPRGQFVRRGPTATQRPSNGHPTVPEVRRTATHDDVPTPPDAMRTTPEWRDLMHEIDTLCQRPVSVPPAGKVANDLAAALRNHGLIKVERALQEVAGEIEGIPDAGQLVYSAIRRLNPIVGTPATNGARNGLGKGAVGRDAIEHLVRRS